MAGTFHRTVAGTLRSRLPREFFSPARSRLWWLPVHMILVALGIFGIARGLSSGSLWLLVPLPILLGLSFGGLAFVAHEALHGALTRNPTLRTVIGFLGFSPFFVAPSLWVAWHNRVHHGHTNIARHDPDAYPTLAEYQSSAWDRFSVDWAAPRGRRLRGLITLVLGFSLQSVHILLVSKKRGYLNSRSYALALLTSFLTLLAWLSLLVFLGPLGFVLAYLVPLALANTIVMAHIITNHSLNPLAEKNDALTTSLTVTVPKWAEFLTLGFGYHVEHHLFPSMSTRFAPKVRALLKELFPTRYQSMPLARALHLLFTTPRVYKTNDLLFDPTDGRTYRTLGTYDESEDRASEACESEVVPLPPPPRTLGFAPDSVLHVSRG